jgi:hypothetical protein
MFHTIGNQGLSGQGNAIIVSRSSYAGVDRDILLAHLLRVRNHHEALNKNLVNKCSNLSHYQKQEIIKEYSR